MLTDKYDRALMYASAVHGGHKRKGTQIPYISHLMAVSALVMEAGGDEDMAIAALLHDAAEDCGGKDRLDDIRVRFKDRVADIVAQCSDSLAADSKHKQSWEFRKRKYLKKFRESKDLDYVLVTAADKLHNARAILTDFRTHGDALWSRFLGTPDAQGKHEKTVPMIIGYYQALAEQIALKLAKESPERRAIARELADTVKAIEAESKQTADRSWEREPQ